MGDRVLVGRTSYSEVVAIVVYSRVGTTRDEQIGVINHDDTVASSLAFYQRPHQDPLSRSVSNLLCITLRACTIQLPIVPDDLVKPPHFSLHKPPPSYATQNQLSCTMNLHCTLQTIQTGTMIKYQG